MNKLVAKARLTLAAAGLLVMFLCAAPAQATIRYTLSLADHAEHIVRVEMRIPMVSASDASAGAVFSPPSDPNEVIVQLPAWNALYQIRDFVQNLREVRAFDESGRPLALNKLDKQTWKVSRNSASKEVKIVYVAEWNEPSPFSSQIDESHAFLNLATVLLYVPARRSEDVVLSLVGLPEGWRTAAALDAGARENEYRAAHYDALVDAPVEAGTFEDFRFEVTSAAGTAKIRVVAHGDGPLSGNAREQLTDTLRKIVAYQTDLMREVPFKEFLFLYHFGAAAGGGGGGMEHANSTAIHGGSAQSVAGVSAHEFFHLWNVKRIRPRTLEPVDYTRENWTRALWFAEGVTSTYTSFTLVRSGLWTQQQFLNDLGGQISSLQRRPARLWKSVEEASLDAWLEKYWRYSQPDTSISYYNKGQILGVLLDILIRDATDNRRSLDNVLRDLNARFAHRGLYYDETADLRASVERIAGKSFADFFQRYVSGAEELPLGETLRLAGLRLEPSAVASADLGFRVERRPDASGALTRVARVGRGGDAERAGVQVGDIVLAVNGEPVPSNLQRWLRQRQAGEQISLTIRRAGTERKLSITLGEQADTSWSVVPDAGAGDKARRILAGLLTGKTD
jgi:predicted metalloprotease with PDZ domain